VRNAASRPSPLPKIVPPPPVSPLYRRGSGVLHFSVFCILFFSGGREKNFTRLSCDPARTGRPPPFFALGPHSFFPPSQEQGNGKVLLFLPFLPFEKPDYFSFPSLSGTEAPPRVLKQRSPLLPPFLRKTGRSLLQFFLEFIVGVASVFFQKRKDLLPPAQRIIPCFWPPTPAPFRRKSFSLPSLFNRKVKSALSLWHFNELLSLEDISFFFLPPIYEPRFPPSAYQRHLGKWTSPYK